MVAKLGTKVPICKYCSNPVKRMKGMEERGYFRWNKTCGQLECISTAYRHPNSRFSQERVCLACCEAYEAKSHTQKYCLVCAPDRKHRRLVKRYGISKPMLEVLLISSNGMCKLCLKRKSAVVDHDHETKKVRGLVCYSCNNLLAAAYDSVETLQRAIDYLEGKL